MCVLKLPLYHRKLLLEGSNSCMKHCTTQCYTLTYPLFLSLSFSFKLTALNGSIMKFSGSAPGWKKARSFPPSFTSSHPLSFPLFLSLTFSFKLTALNDSILRFFGVNSWLGKKLAPSLHHVFGASECDIGLSVSTPGLEKNSLAPSLPPSLPLSFPLFHLVGIMFSVPEFSLIFFCSERFSVTG